MKLKDMPDDLFWGDINKIWEAQDIWDFIVTAKPTKPTKPTKK
tara:strand:- start:748 stop:876 length:129 start_codon:yes stop_codon:yes gene_type:complete